MVKKNHESWLANRVQESTSLSSGFTGVSICDAKTGRELCGLNTNRHFVPASNTKIATLWAVLTTMGDSLPYFHYVLTDTSLTLWGTGNPALLHPYFDTESSLQKLRALGRGKKIYLSNAHVRLSRFGVGWMWDDYSGYYQTELTSVPIHGNAVYIAKDSSGVTIRPPGFINMTVTSDKVRYAERAEYGNHFTLPAAIDTLQDFYQEIPYFHADSVNHSLLSQYFSQPVFRCSISLPDSALTFYGIPTDTVCRRMMQVSDNMLADHLLLGCGMEASDTICMEAAIGSLTASFPAREKQLPVWVDGSGLSRYNLFTPGQLTDLLFDMYRTQPTNRLFSLMAIGGKPGTLRRMFSKETEPYVFAKSGSMSGVYNLSGYLRARSGRWLIVSCMSNHFTSTVAEARAETEQLIEEIRQRF